jgi:hypothetical protein
VIPDNRLKDAIAYLWLSLEEYGGRIISLFPFSLT